MNKSFNNSYPVYITDGGFNGLEVILKMYSEIFILTDENVNKDCLPVLLSKCPLLETAFVIEIPEGESEKNISTFARIITALSENNADRKSLLLNLGGGVISDLGGFVASVYKRGISFINIPTTLLSMADGSLGGKNGINFLEKKNIIGTFVRPQAVYIYTGFLQTLDRREMRSGYAEIIKHILLSDKVKWADLIAGANKYFDDSNLENLITHSIEFKMKITEEDFREDGKRKILNFGHTAGHAFEGVSMESPAPLRHGEAIAIGMIAELYLSCRMAGFPESELNSAVRILKEIFSDLAAEYQPEDLIPFLYADKKNMHDKIAFSLLKSPGEPAGIYYPPIDKIVESLVFSMNIYARTEA